ncbi:MAG: two-component sensor histidine kinase [Deltaproteobacteria bacterium]|nr:two-component sensor histidine kinase [Deltaproteobacteria bacterium]
MTSESRMASLLKKLYPRFLYESVLPGGEKALFNYRRIWWQAIWGVAGVALIPLAVLTVVHHLQYRRALTAEIRYPLARLVSNTERTISSFLVERRTAMDFVVSDTSFEQLADQNRLTVLFHHLRKSFGTFGDIGVIDDTGYQLAYVGPFKLRGKSYKNQNWFVHIQKNGLYISDVFRGYRDEPHFVIAARHDKAKGSFYVVRAAIDAARLTQIVWSLETRPDSDAFVINHDGVLQTDSRFNGNVLERCRIEVPPHSESTVVRELTGPDGNSITQGYVYIKNTPFILMVIKRTEALMGGWWKLRGTLVAFFLASVVGILVAVLIAVTYLVGRVYEADFRRTVAVHKMEHANKMASIGRLAAGVAHEINNPLAIINEKAGLIKDTLTLPEAQRTEERIIKHIDSILQSVERCRVITHRLLGFARHVDVVFEPLDLVKLVIEVLSLLGKEAYHRNVRVTVNSVEDFPQIESDRGQLEQIFLNIINNAFDAVQDGGKIDIVFDIISEGMVAVEITDDGCGIKPEKMQYIFEPFYTTKKEKGTGLGLSITYGLVRKLGGEISVRSTEDKGTTFKLKLPVSLPKQTEEAE